MNTEQQPEIFLTLKEASELSGLSLSTLRRAVKAGQLVTADRVNTQQAVRVSLEGVQALVSRGRQGVQGEQVVSKSVYRQRDFSIASPLYEQMKQAAREGSFWPGFDDDEGLEATQDEASRLKDELVLVRAQLDQVTDEVSRLKSEREALLVRAERAEGVAEGYRLGVDRTLEAFTDDLSRRLAEGVQGVQPLDNSEQVVTYSPAETMNNSEQVRRLTLKERISGRLRPF